jgi:protein SCO1/2
VIRPLLAAALLGLLAACAPPAPFNATEIDGLSYGKDIGIPDTQGRIRRLDEFKDRVTVVFFGFASCPDVCPDTLMRLRAVKNALGAEAERVQVLLVTVDPERDTAERLEAYVRNFDESFIGLRPEPAELDKVVKAFHAIAVKMPTADGNDYTIDHSATLYIYDQDARMRLIARPDLPVDKLADDLRRLLAG